MDEGTLEAAISAYGAQLQQVDTALSAGLDPSQQSDLLQLKEDLSQLIELTESSLVSVKRVSFWPAWRTSMDFRRTPQRQQLAQTEHTAA
ncbi:hypothetical protein KUCAC02_012205 [Chaenocephalus aceratus]|uniref:Uncharacterized protein n=1 Tax=Chaenocephalus aceratus TaxID=36190 RepID=A0ACB9XBI1_CHAAC|nr:hypothetical protein KUCAC02_012205 [Chaenocephalus aceratus]